MWLPVSPDYVEQASRYHCALLVCVLTSSLRSLLLLIPRFLRFLTCYMLWLAANLHPLDYLYIMSACIFSSDMTMLNFSEV